SGAASTRGAGGAWGAPHAPSPSGPGPGTGYPAASPGAGPGAGWPRGPSRRSSGAGPGPGCPLNALIEVSPFDAALTARPQPSRGGPDPPQSPRSPLSPDISRPRSVTTVIPPADARTPGRRLKGQEAERPE